MIDWVDAMCRSWGFAKRRIVFGEGPQPKSMAGRIMEEGPAGAAAHHGRYSELEVLTGDALKVSVAIMILLDLSAARGSRLTEAEYEALFVRYVVPGRLGEKAGRMGVSAGAICHRVGKAHLKLAPMLEQ